jgi:hypothetical protein
VTCTDGFLVGLLVGVLVGFDAERNRTGESHQCDSRGRDGRARRHRSGRRRRHRRRGVDVGRATCPDGHSSEAPPVDFATALSTSEPANHTGTRPAFRDPLATHQTASGGSALRNRHMCSAQSPVTKTPTNAEPTGQRKTRPISRNRFRSRPPIRTQEHELSVRNPDAARVRSLVQVQDSTAESIRRLG